MQLRLLSWIGYLLLIVVTREFILEHQASVLAHRADSVFG